MRTEASAIIDEARITAALEQGQQASPEQVREILAKARELRGLSQYDVSVLCNITDPELLNELFDTARWAKQEIYGPRLVIFAPLYVSNFCHNECTYCAFRAGNKSIPRRALTQEEIAQETRILAGQGHKRILLVAGEAYPKQGFEYILQAIDTIYNTKHGSREIRRINVNIAPLSVENFKLLKSKQIGTFQLFQETYHRETYKRVHVAGPKANFDWRLSAMDRALTAGIDDVGIGVLFGLADWRFEIQALLQHIAYLELHFGIGPHTLSVPRLEPANGSDVSSQPPHPVTDADFQKIVAILRLAVPYTGIIMSTRETAKIRRETFALGVSQISAGSRTNPGGYIEGEPDNEDVSGQFCLGDHRSLDEVVRDICELGYVPSFCTACYRLGRTGADFMDLAKPGEIKLHCNPNALSTLQEYIQDYASPETQAAGETVMQNLLSDLPQDESTRAARLVELVKQGRRDVYC